jgi:hypothetical protein
VKNIIASHLESLKVSFYKYFPQRGKEKNLIADPFNEEFFKEAELSINGEEQLIELSTDSSLNSDFNRKRLITFWVDVSE